MVRVFLRFQFTVNRTFFYVERMTDCKRKRNYHFLSRREYLNKMSQIFRIIDEIAFDFKLKIIVLNVKTILGFRSLY